MDLIKTKSFELAVYAKGSPDSPKLALVLPGRLDSKDYADMHGHVEYLAGRGYHAITFDPPGSWDSPGNIDLYTMTNYIKAINELIEYFGNKPTLLIGHSRGGAMAMLVGTTNPHVTHFVTVMSNMGPSKIEIAPKGGVHVSYRDLPPGGGEKTKRFDLPYSYFEDASQYNALEGLKGSSKPKLFFLGTRDILVKPAAVREVYRVSAEPKVLHELDSDHDYRHHKDVIDEVNSVVGKFLDEYK